MRKKYAAAIIAMGLLLNVKVFANEKIIKVEAPIYLQSMLTDNKYQNEITFEEILNKAIHNSYDAKSARIAMEISKESLAQAKSEYLPYLGIKVNTEYSNGLDNSRYGRYSVGDTIINENTRFQNAVSLNFQHNFIDFGVRKNKINIAKNDIALKEISRIKTLRDLKIEVIDLYEKILLSKIELDNAENELAINYDILNAGERLYDSGLINRLELEEVKMELENSKRNIEKIKIDLCEYMCELSFLTKEKYSPVSTKISEFKKDKSAINIEDFDYKNTCEYKMYQKEINKKKAELIVLKRQNLPNMTLYSSYSLYGSDKNTYSSSISDISQSSISLGISTNIPLTEQLKQVPKIKEVELEIKNLETEQDKQTAKILTEILKTKALLSLYQSEKQSSKVMLDLQNDKYSLAARLDKERLINKIDVYKEKMYCNSKKAQYKCLEQKTLAQLHKLKILLESPYETNGTYNI